MTARVAVHGQKSLCFESARSFVQDNEPLICISVQCHRDGACLDLALVPVSSISAIIASLELAASQCTKQALGDMP